MPSSVISAMYYDEARRSLTIVYRGKRGVYRYHDVDPEEYAAFRTAPSKGTYLNQVFKAQNHPFERLQPSQIIHLVASPTEPDKETEEHGKDNRRGHR